MSSANFTQNLASINYTITFIGICVLIILAILYSKQPTPSVCEPALLGKWQLMPVGLFSLPDMSKAIEWNEERGILTNNSIWNKYGTPPLVVDQGQWGSCTAFSVRYAYLLWLAKRSLPIIEPSTSFLYAKSRLLMFSRLVDSGSTTGSTIQIMKTMGIPSSTTYPYSAPNIFAIPPSFSLLNLPIATGLLNSSGTNPTGFKQLPVVTGSTPTIQWQNQASSFIAEIDAGRSVLISINCYSNFITSQMLTTGSVASPSGSLIGGHAITLIGYVIGSTPQNSVFTFYNSWGLYSGYYQNTMGLFSIPFSYAANPRYSGDWWSL